MDLVRRSRSTARSKSSRLDWRRALPTGDAGAADAAAIGDLLLPALLVLRSCLS